MKSSTDPRRTQLSWPRRTSTSTSIAWARLYTRACRLEELGVLALDGARALLERLVVVAQQRAELHVVDEAVAVGVGGGQQVLGIVVDAEALQLVRQLLHADGARAVLRDARRGWVCIGKR